MYVSQYRLNNSRVCDARDREREKWIKQQQREREQLKKPKQEEREKQRRLEQRRLQQVGKNDENVDDKACRIFDKD